MGFLMLSPKDTDSEFARVSATTSLCTPESSLSLSFGAASLCRSISEVADTALMGSLMSPTNSTSERKVVRSGDRDLKPRLLKELFGSFVPRFGDDGVVDEDSSAKQFILQVRRLPEGLFTVDNLVETVRLLVREGQTKALLTLFEVCRLLAGCSEASPDVLTAVKSLPERLMLSGGDFNIDHWVDAIADLSQRGDREGLADAIRLISLLTRQTEFPPAIKTALKEVSERLGERYQTEMRAAEPSVAPREAPRTSTEVLIHLLSRLKVNVADYPAESWFSALEEQTKRMFLRHRYTNETVRRFLDQVASEALTRRFVAFGTFCVTLSRQLLEGFTAIPMTRLHDNIYGRVYDSALIAALVKDPPPGTAAAMSRAGCAMAYWLQGDAGDWALEVAQRLQFVLKEGDPRFWLPKTPALEAVRDASTGENALEALMRYLRTAAHTGVDCVSLAWTLAKVSLILAALKDGKLGAQSEDWSHCPWMKGSQRNYDAVVTPQASRMKRLATPSKVKTKSAGITLAHHPALLQEDWMVPSERPTTVNRPNLESLSFAARTALIHELPWASGVSGTTNVTLHFLSYMRTRGFVIDSRAFLLGMMMFLVYDGGHSIHEPLWTANQLNEELGLGFSLCIDPTLPAETFVSDYEMFRAMYGELPAGHSLDRAIAYAFDVTLNYFREHSHFSQEDEHSPFPQEE